MQLSSDCVHVVVHDGQGDANGEHGNHREHDSRVGDEAIRLDLRVDIHGCFYDRPAATYISATAIRPHKDGFLHLYTFRAGGGVQSDDFLLKTPRDVSETG